MEAKMKTLSTMSAIQGSAICVVAVLTSMGTVQAQTRAQLDSLGAQCRASVRVDIKGPNCRMWMPPTIDHGCNMSTHAQIAYYDSKVLECVARGGPGRQPKT
jgi:hypothetical protein